MTADDVKNALIGDTRSPCREELQVMLDTDTTTAAQDEARPWYHEPSDRVNALLETLRRSVDAEAGACPVEYFADPEVFLLEKERIFTRSWIFVGHESEIPNNGDFVRRPVGNDDFIIVRDEKGTIHALLNSCPHRGTDITRSDQGHASHFRCPYHNWVFSNSGRRVGAPYQALAYQQIDNDQWSMLAAPHVDTFYGLIFVNLDSGAPKLLDYLGDVAWYLETIVNLHEDGLEVLGAPQRFVLPTDWKSGAENFAGDNYHAPQLHRSMETVGLADYDEHNARSRIFVAGAGSGICAGSGLISKAHLSEVAKLYDLSRLTPEQRRLHETTPVIAGGIFPNFAYSRVGIAETPEAARLPALTFRTWRPLGPGKMEMWSYHLVWRALSDKLKDDLRRTTRMGFGTSGLIEQDDTMAWPGASKTAQSAFARRQRMMFNYQLGVPGMSDSAVVPDWPGPGVGFSTGLNEAGLRHFHELWLQAMDASPDTSFTPVPVYDRFRKEG